MSDVLTTYATGDLLGVSYRTVTRWCESEGLPHMKSGNRRKIDVEILRGWLMQNPHLHHKYRNPTARSRIAAFIEGGNWGRRNMNGPRDDEPMNSSNKQERTDGK